MMVVFALPNQPREKVIQLGPDLRVRECGDGLQTEAPPRYGRLSDIRTQLWEVPASLTGC